MRVDATEAKNRFGYDLGQIKREPVIKNDRGMNVIVPAARDAELYVLQREFNESYKRWIAAQNELVDKVGVFGESLRPW